MPVLRSLSRLALPSVCVAASWACAPRASSTPLGLGPLALAELSARASEQGAAKAKPARRSRPTSEPPQATAASEAEADSDSDAQPSLEDVSEVSAADTAASKEQPAFAGLFAGKDVAVFRISGQPDRQEVDDKAKIRIEAESPTQLRIVLVNSTDGSDLCELTAEAQGNSAQLDGGQPCFTAEGEGAISAEMTSGKVTLSGDRLSMTAEGTLSGTLGEIEFDGSLSYSFKGQRQ
jgi:hypothetical protein